MFGGPVTHLSAGYRLNALGEYKDAHIVCIAYHEILWSLPLPEIKKREEKEIIVPAAAEQSTVIVPKKISKKIGDAG